MAKNKETSDNGFPVDSTPGGVPVTGADSFGASRVAAAQEAANQANATPGQAVASPGVHVNPNPDWQGEPVRGESEAALSDAQRKARTPAKARVVAAHDAAKSATDSATDAVKVADVAARAAAVAVGSEPLIMAARVAKTHYQDAAIKAKASAQNAAETANIAAADAREAALKSQLAHDAADAAGLDFDGVETISTPHLRQHMWDRPVRFDEAQPGRLYPDYEYELPRWVHKNGEQKLVSTPEDCDAAIADGWEIHPSAPHVDTPGGSVHHIVPGTPLSALADSEKV